MTAKGTTNSLPEAQLTLDRLRRGRHQEVMCLAAASAALPLLGLLLLATMLDLAWPLSVGWRWLLSAGSFLLLVAIGVWLFALSRRRLTNQVMARLVEEARPQLDNCLINAMQLAEDGGPGRQFVDELLAEMPVRLEQVLPRELYSQRPRRWLRRLYPLLLLGWLLPLSLAPIGTVKALLRTTLPFLRLQPHANTIIAELLPGDATCKRGQGLDIVATIKGMVPEQVWVQMRDQSGTSEKILLSRQGENENIFTAQTRPLFSSSRYRLLAGDARSAWFSIRLANAPGLLRWEAAVAPPAYTGRATYRLFPDSEHPDVPAGSALVFAGHASAPLLSAELYQGEQLLASSAPSPSATQFTLRADLASNEPLRLRLLAPDGLSGEHALPFIMIPDQAPTVMLVDTPVLLTAAVGQALPIAFRAEDDFGVARVGLERLTDVGRNEEVKVAQPPDEEGNNKNFAGRFLVETNSFPVNDEAVLRFRLWAEDRGANAGKRRGYSPIVQISFQNKEKKQLDQNAARQQAEQTLADLIKKQREALRDTRQLAEQAIMGQVAPVSRITVVENAQRQIRALGTTLLQNRGTLGGRGEVLATLVNQEMKEAVEMLVAVPRVPENNRAETLNEIRKMQTAILAALTGLRENAESEQRVQEKSDIFAALQKVIREQRDTLRDTLAAQQGQDISRTALAHNQDHVAEAILAFTDLCLDQAERGGQDDFAVQLRAAHDVLAAAQAYESALTAAEHLENNQLPSAVEQQQLTMKALLQALDILNKWRVNQAKNILEAAGEVIGQVKEQLQELEKKQARIAEVTRELQARGPMDDETRKQLALMDKEQEEMADLIEKLANDLYQFPELPVCNELNTKMREVYEEVLQALDSENLPSIEIAVQKEDSLLDAIRNTTERIEDVEMWLPDVPDHFVWNMESFDTDEFPDIPLVPLPDELEDLVGELLEQAESIDAQSQDTTGNNIIADMEMGWAVMDGPMPSFAAKGKSGNTRPNDNEMTGRSGSGREGQATGELVENHVTGYEGRETHARRTADQFQKGMVTEDEGSTLKARATGGGKLGGESESIGMFGNAPRRDLHMAGAGPATKKLRQEAEALYASARLLYIGAGSLGEAARDLRALEKSPPEMRELGGLQRRILRRLQDSQVELQGGVVLPMPVTTISQTGGSAVADHELEKMAPEYLQLLNEYYRSLDEEK